jgi:hypothetical protein
VNNNILILFVHLFLTVFINIAWSADDDSTDIARLRESARVAAQKKQPEQDSLSGNTVFKSGTMGLQALNPEISITGDMFARYRIEKNSKSGPLFAVRGLGLHFEAWLDPYTKTKAAVPVSTEGIELGEFYMSRYAVARGLSVTLGKFRQEFGTINRWHKHALDQFDFPLALRTIFGPGGLNQIGTSLDCEIPAGTKSDQAFTLQITNGQNPFIFSGNILSLPSILGRYKFFTDLSSSTYFEAGATVLGGWNDSWHVVSGDSLGERNATLGTRVYGLEFVFRWEPTGRMRYRNIEWRTEGYMLDRDLLRPDNGEVDNLRAWGAYSYVESKLSRKLDIGVRGDIFVPSTKQYADAGEGLGQIASRADDTYQWAVAPYVTWYQSPFVRFRIEFDHTGGKGTIPDDNTVVVQAIFAAGPHKHERY